MRISNTDEFEGGMIPSTWILYPLDWNKHKLSLIKLEKMTHWIEDNVSNKWGMHEYFSEHRFDGLPYGYSFYFESKEDAMAFRLRWL